MAMSYVNRNMDDLLLKENRKQTSDLALQLMQHHNENRMQPTTKSFGFFSTYSPRLVSQKTKAEKERRKQSSGETRSCY